MNTREKISFFGFGFLLGITILLIIFKDRDFNYFSRYLPQGRVLESIHEKQITFSADLTPNVYQKIYDSTYFKQIFLKEASIDFSKSQPRKKPCGLYRLSNDTVQVSIENCRKKAKVIEIKPLK